VITATAFFLADSGLVLRPSNQGALSSRKPGSKKS
jgi:hypothetical protein